MASGEERTKELTSANESNLGERRSETRRDEVKGHEKKERER